MDYLTSGYWLSKSNKWAEFLFRAILQIGLGIRNSMNYLRFIISPMQWDLFQSLNDVGKLFFNLFLLVMRNRSPQSMLQECSSLWTVGMITDTYCMARIIASAKFLDPYLQQLYVLQFCWKWEDDFIREWKQSFHITILKY